MIVRLLIVTVFWVLGFAGLGYSVRSFRTQEAITAQKSLLEQIEYDAALEKSKQAVALSPEAPQAWVAMGETLYAMASIRIDSKLGKQAIDAYRKAADLDPLNERRWRELAKTQALLGEPKGALITLTTALSRDPYNVETHYVKGYALQMLGRLEEARKEYETSYLILPNPEAANALKALNVPLPTLR